MQLTMSREAEGDGAWGTVLNALGTFTFDVTLKDQTYFVGRVLEADELQVTFLVGRDAKERRVFIEDIDTLEYT